MKGEDQLIPVDTRRVASLNSSQILRAHRQVYSPFKSDDLQTEIDKVHRERPPLISKITPEMIEALSR